MLSLLAEKKCKTQKAASESHHVQRTAAIRQGAEGTKQDGRVVVDGQHQPPPVLHLGKRRDEANAMIAYTRSRVWYNQRECFDTYPCYRQPCVGTHLLELGWEEVGDGRRGCRCIGGLLLRCLFPIR